MPLKSPFPAFETAAAPAALAVLPAAAELSILERGADASRQTNILDSLPANIALLDADGVIVEVNESWRRWGADHGSLDPGYGLGANYLMVCDAVVGGQSLPAFRAAAGIRAVLRGETRRFSMEYVMELESGDLWFLLLVTPVGGGAQPTGATVMHLDITARKLDEGTVWRFAAAMDAMSDGVFLVDRGSMKVTYVNDAACRLHSLPRDELLALKPWEVMATTRTELETKYDGIAAQGGVGEPEEVFWRRSDGTRLWIEIRRHAHCLDGSVSMVVLVRDITARKAAESRILYLNRVYAILSGINTLIVRVRDREELFKEACRLPVEHGGFPVCWIGVLDARTRRLVPVATAGMSAEYREAMAHTLEFGSLESLEHTYTQSAVRNKRIQICNDSGDDPRVVNGEYHAKHGIRSFAILPLIVDESVVGVLSLYAAEPDFFHDEEIRLLTELAGDVSFAIDHIDKQEKLDYLASYDPLTGLPNRRLFLDRLAQFVRMAQGTDQKLAVYITDLERFRNINDSLGRASGDELLRQVGKWLTSQVGDAVVLGRLDTDHFAVIVPECEDEGDVARVVETLLNAFIANTFRLGGVAYRLAVKAGVAIFPNDGADADTLFKNAGAALTKAKAGGDRYLFYAERMTQTVAGRLGLENQLRQALDREEFVLHYQPKVHLASGEVVAAEALLRWNDPRTGLVPPARFIPVLEETGLIFEVGRWVLNKAVEDYLRWRREGFHGVRIAVNVSPLQLRHSGFVAEIERIAGIDPCVAAGLELEITESLIMENVKLSIAALHVVRERGITIAIDDFGTGYSSLSYLAKLPIDTLKIDRSFILDLAAGAAGVSLVSTIINLAHSLDLKVVAEGVETADQAAVLRRLACDEAQGYWFSKPLPVADFETKYLKRER
jgi:diguanylate cyclase (GGDEF)-like protein/PAS domain S-box-containing protein